MTPRADTNNPEPPEDQLADLAEAAIGLSTEQLAEYEEVIVRFLRGHYFSLDEEGKVADWNRHSEARFGWSALEVIGEDFFEYIASPGSREAAQTELAPVVTGTAGDGLAGAAFELETQRRDLSLVRTDIAAVPIRVGDGYRLNKVLGDIITHRGNPIEITRMKKRHADVLRLIVTALDGGKMPEPLGDDGWKPGGHRIEERWLPAGALVIFDGSEALGSTVGQREVDARGGGPLPTIEAQRLRDENDQLRARLRGIEREAEDLREELEDVKARGAGARGRRPHDAGDPRITAEHIKVALREDRFTLHCQPVLDLRAGAIAQHELLLRMAGPEGELALPQAFLGTARRAGLIGAIDQWVIRQAIRTIDEQAQIGRDVCLEVNLSNEALHDVGLLPTIEREFATTRIDPGRLILEVTEQIAIADPDGARSLAKNLRAIGCGFALDDFGTSFGSFRFLKDMPVDYLKIDGDLIVSLTESRTAQLVVKALVDVARGTGAETIAVFASDRQTLEMLRELGVDYAQGHKVGQPRPIAEALSELEAQGLRSVEPPIAQAASGTRKRAK